MYIKRISSDTVINNTLTINKSSNKIEYFQNNEVESENQAIQDCVIKSYQLPNNTKVELMQEEHDCLIAIVNKDNKTTPVNIDWITGIPKEIQIDRQKLQIFLRSTYIKLNKLDNNEYHIYIYQQGNGGGMGGFVLGVGQVVAGVGITVYTGGIGAAVGGGALISSGINGIIYGYQEKECDPKEYLKNQL